MQQRGPVKRRRGLIQRTIRLTKVRIWSSTADGTYALAYYRGPVVVCSECGVASGVRRPIYTTKNTAHTDQYLAAAGPDGWHILDHGDRRTRRQRKGQSQ